MLSSIDKFSIKFMKFIFFILYQIYEIRSLVGCGRFKSFVCSKVMDASFIYFENIAKFLKESNATRYAYIIKKHAFLDTFSSVFSLPEKSFVLLCYEVNRMRGPFDALPSLLLTCYKVHF